jgi:hypothetical protein
MIDREARFVMIFFLAVALIVGTCITVAAETDGCSRAAAIGIGAFGGVVTAWLPLYLLQSLRCTIWRWTRGYPFAKGDIVEITSRPHCGLRGRVMSIGQAPWILEVFVESAGEADTFSAGQLRKLEKAETT